MKKITKCPNFTRFLPDKLAKYTNFYNIFPKINKIPEFYMIFDQKMPEFYIIIARKIFPPNFRERGARVPLPHRLLRLWAGVCTAASWIG